MKLIVGLALIVAVPVQAGAGQGSCDIIEASGYAAVRPISEAIAPLANAGGARDEFETTAAYEARMAALSVEDVAIEFPLLQSGFSYDADRQRANYDQFSVPTTCASFNGFEQVRSQRPRRGAASALCLFKEVGQHEERSYSGSNAYGATAEVSVVREEYEGLFLGYGDFLTSPFTGERVSTNRPLFEIDLPPTEARSLRENGVLIALVRPKPPYVATATTYLAPTIRNPTERIGEAQFLVGDLLCIAIADAALGRVYITRPID